MRVNVHMLAFQDGRVREVEIPQEALASIGDSQDAVLSLAFEYGQNFIQPSAGYCSVSVGDVIEHGGAYYIVKPVGFGRLSRHDFIQYRLLDKDGRNKYAWGC